MPVFLAVDPCAESGRVVRGQLHDGRLTVEGVHRSGNRPVAPPTGLHGGVQALFAW